jgi:DNA-binding NtrC family response regulator
VAKQKAVDRNKDLSIFIVDDDPMCSQIYKQYLKNLGYTNVELFDNGQQCINELTRKPDIIFLDHEMTPINGMDTLKKIKRFNPDIYLVYISAQEDMQVAINALKYGVFDYVIKGELEEQKIVSVMLKIVNVMELLSEKSAPKWRKLMSFLTF